MSDVTLRLEKGSSLTHQELDNNFKFPFRWAPNYQYTIGMLVSYNYSFYECNNAHTSSSVFDSSKWQNYSGSSSGGSSTKSNIIQPNNSVNVINNQELSYCDNLYNKGVINITGGTDSNFGSGSAVSTDGVLIVMGILFNEGTIYNSGKIIL